MCGGGAAVVGVTTGHGGDDMQKSNIVIEVQHGGKVEGFGFSGSLPLRGVPGEDPDRLG